LNPAPVAEAVPESAPIAAAPATPPSEASASAAPSRAERVRLKAQRHAADQLLHEFAAALERGDLLAAHGLHGALEQALAALGDAPTETRERFSALQIRYADLRHWQHWSNNQRRRRLCNEIDALIAAAPHPDALVTRIREAREEWQSLNIAEGVESDAE